MVATLVLEASVERRESSSLSSRTMFQFQGSTAVVQLTVNQLVAGSIPALGAKFIALIAQLVEQCISNAKVGSSNLSWGTNFRGVI
jgi:FMN-dependent NADH-azoreductase